MKSVLLLDQGANPLTAPEYLKPSLKPVIVGGKIVEWIYPKGTFFEGDQAVFMVKTGQNAPLDEECSAACGMTAEQLKAAQESYEMDFKGMRSKDERELFAAGVIAGVEKDGKGGVKYIDGPNAEKYRQLVKEEAAKKEDDE